MVKFKSKLFLVFFVSMLSGTLTLFFNATNVALSPQHEVIYQTAKAVKLKSLINKDICFEPIKKRAPAATTFHHRHKYNSNIQPVGQNVIIDFGQVAYIDQSMDLDTLIINGELHCNSALAPSAVEIKAKTIIVNGVFQCGTAAQPYTKKLIISMKHSNVDAKADAGYRGIIVEQGGRLTLNGSRKNAGWYKLNQTLEPGDQSLEIDFGLSRSSFETLIPLFPWKVGDKIAVGPTGYNYAEAEKFTITGISQSAPYRIYLDHPAAFRHWGENETISNTILGTIKLDERAEVANLTRSIVIRADETSGLIDESSAAAAQRGGHVMVHYGGQAYIDSVEFYKMGQAGIMGRYPFHWHWADNVNGQYIKNSSIHHSFQRCVTVHRTHSALVERNTCFDFKGHGYFLEDGNEINNQIIGNLAIMAKPPTQNKLLLASDDINNSESQGRFPSVSSFWISNPKNIVKYNIASGSVGTGFWMSFENEILGPSGSVVARPISEITTEFNYNTAHATKTGFTWDGAPTGGLTNNPNNPADRRVQSAHYMPPNVPYFIGLKAFKNSKTGIYLRGQSVIYKNTIVADNGWSFWLAYNQIIKDSVFIGKTNNSSPELDEYYSNNGRDRKTGVVLYDGPFEVHHSDFVNFSTENEMYTNQDGNTINLSSIPFTSTGGSNKFINVTSRLRFMPSPLHRIHVHGPETAPTSLQLLGNGTIRDLDGTLAGRKGNSVITATRSLGVTAQSNCTDGGETFFNFKVCPGNYTEGSQTFMRWGSPMASPWGTPFIVKRSDGAFSYPKSEWGSLTYQGNNLFATVNNQNYSYELLPLYQYEKDRLIGAKAAMDATSEVGNPNSPVIKVIAYGTNCRLDDGAVQVASLNQLKQQNVTSYYTEGENFYVRVIPTNKWDAITNSPLVTATSNSSLPTRFGITCDPGYLPYDVRGGITSVTKGATETTITGWACNYTHNSAIQVKLYAYGPAIAVPHNTTPKALALNTYTFIKQVASNQPSDGKIAFKCGKMTSAGRAFNFTIPNSELAKFSNHKVYVQGLSNSAGGTNKYLDKSGIFYVIPRPIPPLELDKAKL